MFETVKNHTQTYIASLEAVNETHAKAKADLTATYTGAALTDRLARLQEGNLAARNELREKYRASIPSDFEAIKDEITRIAMTPIPTNVADVLESTDGLKLTDAEKEAMLKLAGGNYLAMRKVRSMLKIDAPKEYDNALSVADDLERLVLKTLANVENGSTGSYDALNLMSGMPFDFAEETVGTLTNAYGSQAGSGE